MDKRERFVTSVTCPECALNGSATWEENESGNLETTIKSLPLGFKRKNSEPKWRFSDGVASIEVYRGRIFAEPDSYLGAAFLPCGRLAIAHAP